MDNFFVAEDITKTFVKHKALDNLSVHIPRGSIYGLLGPNGAGKTTFIRIINQITAPDTGRIWFNGEKLSSKHIEHIGYLPEERGLYKKMKVGEQALYLTQLKGLSRQEALRRLKYWFEKFEIQTWWDKKLEELSKGMAQKVQFVTTILHQPELLIFDEPFSGFDPINADLLKREILNLREKGATVIFSTHNMSSVEEICDHIALINDAKKVVEGPIDSIRDRFAPDIYELEFSGYFNRQEASLSSYYEILDVKEREGITILRIRRTNADVSTNELIKQFMASGNITSFRKIVPSMNDIFIRLVKGEVEVPVDNTVQ